MQIVMTGFMLAFYALLVFGGIGLCAGIGVKLSENEKNNVPCKHPGLYFIASMFCMIMTMTGIAGGVWEIIFFFRYCFS